MFRFTIVNGGMIPLRKKRNGSDFLSVRKGGRENRVHFFDWGLFYICAYLKRISDFFRYVRIQRSVRNF